MGRGLLMLELADAFPMLSKHSMEECSVQIPVSVSPNHLSSPGCGATARAPVPALLMAVLWLCAVGKSISLWLGQNRGGLPA